MSLLDSINRALVHGSPQDGAKVVVCGSACGRLHRAFGNLQNADRAGLIVDLLQARRDTGVIQGVTGKEFPRGTLVYRKCPDGKWIEVSIRPNDPKPVDATIMKITGKPEEVRVFSKMLEDRMSARF